MNTIDFKNDEEIIKKLQLENASTIRRKRLIWVYKAAIKKILKISENS